MKATCTACAKPFLFPDERFGERESVRVRCPSCKAAVTLRRPAPAATPAGQGAAGPAPASGSPVDESGPRPASPPRPAPEQAPGDDGPPTLKVTRRQVTEGAAAGQEEEHMPPMPEGVRVSVALLSGPDTGQVLPCKVSRAVIGRAGSDLPIQDDEISRRHAMVEIRDDRYFLKDLGSTNGTFVDERRISETEIFNHTEFRVGVTRCMLIVATEDEL